MKLPTLLKSLHEGEHKEFEKFLQSPFFKASGQYLAYFKYLCKHHKGFELGKAELEAAYRRCFGKEALTEAKLYSLMSGLARQVEQYLAVSTMMESEGGHLQQLLLVRALGQRNMGAYFRAEAQRLVVAVEAQPVKDKDGHLLLEQLHHEVYFNPDTPKYNTNSPALPLAMGQLDLYYCIAKLRYAAEMKARERLLQVKYEIPMLDAVLDMTAAPELVEVQPLAAIYHQLVQIYLGGVGEQEFKALRLLFAEKFHLLRKEDQHSLLLHLINCGSSLMAQDCELHEEILSLYKMAIDADMLLDGKRVTHGSFTNIVTFAALCKEYEWAEGFMKQFSPFLDDTLLPPTLSLSKSIIYHAKGLLDKAQSCLEQEVFMITAFDMVARGLLMKILFERYVKEENDYEFLVGHLKSYEKYVGIKSLTNEKKTAYLNTIRFVKRMTTIKSNKKNVPEHDKEILRRKLCQLSPTMSKKWLREVIESL
ncbi:MAG: hypothetical protein IT258_15160 [Saprospiraceae bacterium]|nr:hypothetical protein [Saprospiraceae bacterium]